MCIIVAKPQGVEMPSYRILSNCFDTNSDGAGFMIANGKTVSIKKGFMDWNSFVEAIEKAGDLTERSVVMHFRIATHGDVQPGCCHPFPVTDDKAKLSARFTESRVAVAHNGIISGMKTDKNTSDTMAYISSVIAPIRRMSEDFMHNDNALDIMEATVGSKLCFLDNSGDIVTIGQFIEDDGVFYSNTSYLNSWKRYTSYNSEVWSAYDDYYSKYRLSESTSYGYDEDDYYESLVASLPYYACQDCLNAYECVRDHPMCEDENTAWDIAEMLYEEYEDEQMALAMEKQSKAIA